MIAHQHIYDAHLAGVSRSFAACIQELTQPLRSYVALSYLLCRVCDTLEDAPWASGRAQQAAFFWFDAAIKTRPSAVATSAFRATLPKDIPPAEAQLLDATQALFSDLHHMPPRIRRVLQRTLLCMSFGMRRFMQRRAQHGRLQLRDLADVNRYCFIVAGVVGTLLTRLFLLTHPRLCARPGMAKDAVHFGLLLQKINLLKDQQQDEREGRFLVPNRPLVIASLRTHAKNASRYLLRVPPKAQSFRRFCGWSLFLAAKSLTAIESTPGGKLPREQTEQLFHHVGRLCEGNVALRAALRQAVETLPPTQTPIAFAPRAQTADWLRRLPDHRRQLALTDALL